MKNYFLERAKAKEIKKHTIKEVRDEFGNVIQLPPGVKIKLGTGGLQPIPMNDSDDPLKL